MKTLRDVSVGDTVKVVKLIVDGKKGRSASCGCGCEACALHDKCHAKK